MNKQRRQMLLAMAGLVASSSDSLASTLIATPPQSAGPFYPETLPLDDDNDLTRVTGRSLQAKGSISDLSGQILDINGNPLQGLRIEIWQCDANGRYRHSGDNASRKLDNNFQGHGNSLTDGQGRYRFRTIRPVPYPGRTPHIHIAIFQQGELPFVTQLYVEGDARNQHDFLFNRVPADRRHLVMADFTASNHSGAKLKANFDIILNRSAGTPQSS